MDGFSINATGRELLNYSIYVQDGVIKNIEPSNSFDLAADINIDASKSIVVPGLINTHHHLFQTLTKAVKNAQNQSLFGWLKTLYPIWMNIKPIHLKSAVSIGLSELIISGCTTTSDHLYIFPNGILLEDEIEIANRIGIRFHATRGSMSIGESKGGLPPDNLVENEKHNTQKSTGRIIILKWCW